MAQHRLLSFLSVGGRPLNDIEADIKWLKQKASGSWGVNYIHHFNQPEKEMKLMQLLLRYNITLIEASSFMSITKELVQYRVSGLEKVGNKTHCHHHIIAKLSHPKVSEAFLSPPPKKYLTELLNEGAISSQQATLATSIPMADAITIEGDSGGHTSQGLSLAIFPTLHAFKNTIETQHNYTQDIFIGLGGGIGTPHAINAAFSLGADYVMSGSINQCTLEAATSSLVKELLCEASIQDFSYAPAGDMFEIGAKVHVYKKGILFPVRANHLYQLYQHYNNIEDIPSSVKARLENDYFQAPLTTVWEEIERYSLKKNHNNHSHTLHSKRKMALIFKTYFRNSSQYAIKGMEKEKLNFQIHSSPAIAAFNQWAKMSPLNDWKKRSVSDISLRLLESASLSH